MMACLAISSIMCHFLLPPNFISRGDNYPDTGGQRQIYNEWW
jgi:hypothetical protein